MPFLWQIYVRFIFGVFGNWIDIGIGNAYNSLAISWSKILEKVIAMYQYIECESKFVQKVSFYFVCGFTIRKDVAYLTSHT